MADSLRILVVDGYVDAANSLALLLKLYGHEAHVAYSGREALAEARALGPDVVIAELVLPQMDGLQLAQQLRGQMTLIALTGLGQEIYFHMSQEAGYDLHFLKPIDPEELPSILSRCKKVVLTSESAR